MFAKCPNHNIIRLVRQRVTCPMCRGRLTRPTRQELQEIGENAMDRGRAARAYCEAFPHDEELKLIAFMAVIHGTYLSRGEASRWRGRPR